MKAKNQHPNHAPCVNREEVEAADEYLEGRVQEEITHVLDEVLPQTLAEQVGSFVMQRLEACENCT
jgi:hypothetical protein